MSTGPNSYRTALGRARGLGSAKEGVNGFIAERVTGMALVPLCLWAVYAVVTVAPAGYDGAVAALHAPINAVMAGLLILIGCAHMKAGVRVVVEDYIHQPGTKIALLLLNTAVCWLAAALGLFSILKVALSGVGA